LTNSRRAVSLHSSFILINWESTHDVYPSWPRHEILHDSGEFDSSANFRKKDQTLAKEEFQSTSGTTRTGIKETLALDKVNPQR